MNQGILYRFALAGALPSSILSGLAINAAVLAVDTAPLPKHKTVLLKDDGSFVRAEHAGSAGRNSIFTHNLLRNRLHMQLGITFSSDLLSKEAELSRLGAALGGGAAKQEFERYSFVEKRIPLSNPSQQQGGCPDIPAVPMKATKLGSYNLPDQYFTIQGKDCAVTDASGNSLTLLGPEFHVGLRYEIVPWISVLTGFNMAVSLPVSYMARFRYLGESKDIQINGLTDPLTGAAIQRIGADILIDSTARLSMSATSIEIPLIFQFNLLRAENSQIYFGLGMVFSILTYKRYVEASQSINVLADGKIYDLAKVDYVPVENKEVLAGQTLALTIGGRYQIADRVWCFLEVRWLRGGGVSTVKGTNSEPGNSYASDTLAAQVLNQISSGTVAQALRNDSNPNGARDVSGLTAGYRARWFLGISYAL